MSLSPEFRNKLREHKRAHRRCMRELGTMLIGERRMTKTEVGQLTQLFRCMNEFDTVAMHLLCHLAEGPEDPYAP